MNLKIKDIQLINITLLFKYTFSDRIVFTFFIKNSKKNYYKTLEQYKKITKKL